ncbi:prepilin peptidase [Candidatus Microgenomates bacterium]|nr:prepilin peptidase [Candidatus Microgenomates bacterium]
MLIYPFLFLFGICLGSFLNVVIDRAPKGKSIIRTRSHCDYCKKTLGVLDLIPIVSFLLLGGRCRYCGKKLSWQYPLIELATGILFVTTYYFLPDHFNLVEPSKLISQVNINFVLNLLEKFFYLILVLYMITIFMIDLKLEIVLERVINSAIIITLLFKIALLVFFFLQNSFVFYPSMWSPFKVYGFFEIFINFLTGGAIALFFLFLIEVSKHRGMGEGDVKIGFWIGLALGLKAILALFIAFVGGAMVGLLLIVLGKKKFGQTVPLAPFLMTGMYIALLWGDKIINWYLATFLR